MELPVWGQLLSAAALFGVGWSARVYFERHKFKALEDHISNLEKELATAKKTQQHEINVRCANSRYNNGSKSLRLVEEREENLVALKHDIDAAIARGGSFTDRDIAAALAADTE